MDNFQLTAQEYIDILIEQRNAAMNEVARQGAIIKKLMNALNNSTLSKSNGVGVENASPQTSPEQDAQGDQLTLNQFPLN